MGNVYYRERGGKRRWVIYRMLSEPSQVPPEWHAWLHGLQSDPPTKREAPRHSWQKSHLPNLTGTDLAYRPPGHTLAGGKQSASTRDYQPWTPD